MTAATAARATSTGPVDAIGTDLMRTLRALKLGQMADTLPERLTLARTRGMGHGAFLELVLSDEVTRRESRSAMLRWECRSEVAPGCQPEVAPPLCCSG